MGAPRFLEQFGEQIARNGYEVIPILPGQKRPFGKEWQDYDGSPAGVRSWVKKGKGGFGVGIMTRHSPAVDIDCHDWETVKHMVAFTEELCGKTLHRVGLPPKTLLLYRTSEPFVKVQTGIYLDDKGRNVKLEVLADGQQFVAAHIHPDTGKPYQWEDKQSVLNHKLSDLPEITQEQAEQIRDEFARIAGEKGWQLKSRALQRKNGTGASAIDEDDPFAGISTKIDIADDDLRAKLFMVPDAEDHDTWFHVGMALYHQYDGEDYGLQLWHEWSAEASNYDPKELDRRWPTFSEEGKGRSPITARFILRRGIDEEDRLKTEELEDVRARISALNKENTLPDLVAVCDHIKGIAFSNPIREMLTGLVKDAFKRVTGTAARIGSIRDMIRYENPDNRNMPNWLRPFVYCTFDETFYSTTTRTSLSHRAFDSAYGRFMLTKKDQLEGRSAPEHPPTHVALHQYQIPVAFNKMYLPGAEPLFTHAGLQFVNSFTDTGYPEIPGEFSYPEKRAISIVEHHFEHLFRNGRDRRLLADFLTYIIQNPGKRINWAIFIQGAEGDGKSFFGDLLKTVLGWENVNTIQGDALEEKYTPWAEGAMVCFIEDVRLHGSNRYAAINRLKPFITNTAVPIRRMNVDIYKVVNTVSYLLTSNMKDAIPEGEEGSRYFPMFSNFQTQEAARAFKAANPDYYTRLFGALDYAGALRKYFLERQIGDDFDPKERAPISSNRREMVSLNSSDEDDALNDSIADSTKLDYSPILLDSSLIAEEFTGRNGIAPYGKALNRFLSTHGFTMLGRFKINGEARRYWTKHPQIWSIDDEERMSEEIRSYLDPHGI